MLFNDFNFLETNRINDTFHLIGRDSPSSRLNDSFRTYNFQNLLNGNFGFRDYSHLNDSIEIYRERERMRETENESLNLKEIKSKNDYFMEEKNINYKLYPLYINWKKIENNSIDNAYYNIFKLFGYFGIAIFNLLIEANNNEGNYNHKNFLKSLYYYEKKYFLILEIKNNEFFKRLICIYDDVIHLIKNKIIIFKEITVFLIVMRLYETYFSTINENNKLIEVLKYQYLIICHLKDDEYKKIYNKYYKHLDLSECHFCILRNSCKYPKTKSNYINYIKSIYKKINKKPQIIIKEESQ